MSALTLNEAKAVLQGLGATIRSHNDEYEVRYALITHSTDPAIGYARKNESRGYRRKQTTATYFTDDLADALATGQAMVAQVQARHVRQAPGSQVSMMQAKLAPAEERIMAAHGYGKFTP